MPLPACAFLVPFLALLAACSPDKTPEPCGPRRPAFGVQVTAGGDVLPEDTFLRVYDYQGGQSESYRPSQAKQNADVCCQAGEPVVGELPRVSCATAMQPRDAATVTAIQCTLWTSGPANIVVRAEGYEDLFRRLNTRLQENESCGEETVEEVLILGRREGGT